MHFPSAAAATMLLASAVLIPSSVATHGVGQDPLVHRAAHNHHQHVRGRRHAERDGEHLNSFDKRDFNGQATYFAVGLGACGSTAHASQSVVALNSAQYGSGKYCGKQIRITANGHSAIATIQDECPSCSYGSLDLSEGLFKQFYPTSKGEFDMQWSWVDPSLNPAPPKAKVRPKVKPSPQPKPSPKPKPKPAPETTTTSFKSSSSSSSSSSTATTSSSASRPVSNSTKPAETKSREIDNIADLHNIIAGFRSVVKIGQKLPPPTSTPKPSANSGNGTQAAVATLTSGASSAPLSASSNSTSSAEGSIASSSLPDVSSVNIASSDVATTAPTPAPASLSTESKPPGPFYDLTKAP